MSKRILAILVVFLFAFAGLALASPPVPPPSEGSKINTATSVTCVGTVTETESYNKVYGGAETGGFDASGPSWVNTATGGSAAQTKYTEDLAAVDGTTVYNKTFASSTHSDPNVKVAKDIAYVATATDPIAQIDVTEKIGISVVAQNGADLTGFVSLCPFATTQAASTNEFIAAGSNIKSTNVMSHSDTSATTTATPAVSYGITAQGVGTITAGMNLNLLEGAPTPNTVNGKEVPTGVETYVEKAAASGAWSFSKSMSFISVIPSVSLPEPFSLVP